MIKKFKNFILIKENPDTLYDGDKTLYCFDNESRPFFITANKDHTKVKKLYFSKNSGYHDDIEFHGIDDMAYPGRIWLYNKILSFWVYPNETLFKDIIKELEKAFDINIFNNGWRIEIIKFQDEKFVTNYNASIDDYYSDKSPNKKLIKYEIIPIEEYYGSEDVSEEEKILHLMNWKEKELAKKIGKFHFKGIGSDKTAWDQPRNIRYRQAIYQENIKY